MTGLDVDERCRWCARPVPPRGSRGPRRTYCRQSCRQQAYLARRLAEAHGLGPDDMIVDRGALESLQGLLYCLQCAVEDVEKDLGESASPADVKTALDWLLQNARPLADVWIEPKMAEALPEPPHRRPSRKPVK